jgi:hypothetical protein
MVGSPALPHILRNVAATTRGTPVNVVSPGITHFTESPSMGLSAVVVWRVVVQWWWSPPTRWWVLCTYDYSMAFYCML